MTEKTLKNIALKLLEKLNGCSHWEYNFDGFIVSVDSQDINKTNYDKIEARKIKPVAVKVITEQDFKKILENTIVKLQTLVEWYDLSGIPENNRCVAVNYTSGTISYATNGVRFYKEKGIKILSLDEYLSGQGIEYINAH